MLALWSQSKVDLLSQEVSKVTAKDHGGQDASHELRIPFPGLAVPSYLEVLPGFHLFVKMATPVWNRYFRFKQECGEEAMEGPLCFLKNFKFEFSCFTMLCWFLLYSKLNQLYVYVYPLFFEFPPLLGHQGAFSKVPCAI